jgi:hypothetical protein
MNVPVLLLGVLYCLAAQAAGEPSQGAPTSKAAPAPQQSWTGCIDEQSGHYVLLDDQMLKIAGLQSAGAEKDVFAKYLGHKVQVKGTKSAGPDITFTVTAIVQIADKRGQAK